MTDSENDWHIYFTWIEKHERLLLTILGGLVLWFGIGKIDTLIANHDHANLEQAKVVAAVQQEKNEELAKQAAVDKAAYDDLNAKVTARDAQLQQLQVTLVSALAKQQQIDKTMTQPELATRWLQLVPDAEPLIFDPNGGIKVSTEGARATVIELEKVPVLTNQLDNETKLYTDDEQLLTAGKTLNDTLYQQIDGLKLQIVDNAKVCSAQVSVVKAEARKSKKRWFIAGYVLGFLSRQAIKSYTGL